jgi:hypothetical protein
MEFLNEDEIRDIVNEDPTERPPREEGESDIENDLDDWVEDDNVDIKCLFDADVVHSVDELLCHDKDLYGFDLKQCIEGNCKDDISIIKLINFIRAEVAQCATAVDRSFVTDLEKKIDSMDFLNGETFMKPTIEDDQLLFLYAEAFLPAADFEEDD